MIQGPEGAIPTRHGWVDPYTNKLLQQEKLSDPQINLWKKENAEFVNKVEEELRPPPVEPIPVQEVVEKPAPKKRGRPKKNVEEQPEE